MLALSEEGQACSLCGVEVCPGVRLEGWLRWFAYPLGGGVCRGPCPGTLLLLPTPCFAPGSSEVTVGFFGLSFFFWSRICPSCSCIEFFLVPHHFFAFFFAGGEVLSRCMPCSKGSQPVSALLCSNTKFSCRVV